MDSAFFGFGLKDDRERVSETLGAQEEENENKLLLFGEVDFEDRRSY